MRRFAHADRRGVARCRQVFRGLRKGGYQVPAYVSLNEVLAMDELTAESVGIIINLSNTPR